MTLIDSITKYLTKKKRSFSIDCSSASLKKTFGTWLTVTYQNQKFKSMFELDLY